MADRAAPPAAPHPLPTAETLRFLERSLPGPPARVLEVGCGDGRLAGALAGQGYDVTALDEALEVGREVERASVRWVETEFLVYEGAGEGDAFDAVLFTRSLHRMAPLDRMLDHAAGLLRPGGVLVGEEFAFDRVNLPTARWWFDLEAVLVAAGILAAPDPALLSVRNPLGRWRQEHSQDPPLATGHDMLAAVRERFETSPAEEAPYLYRYVFDRTTAPGNLAARVGGVVHEIESRLIRERDIAAAGLRFIGKRPA